MVSPNISPSGTGWMSLELLLILLAHHLCRCSSFQGSRLDPVVHMGLKMFTKQQVRYLPQVHLTGMWGYLIGVLWGTPLTMATF